MVCVRRFAKILPLLFVPALLMAGNEGSDPPEDCNSLPDVVTTLVEVEARRITPPARPRVPTSTIYPAASPNSAGVPRLPPLMDLRELAEGMARVLEGEPPSSPGDGTLRFGKSAHVPRALIPARSPIPNRKVHGFAHNVFLRSARNTLQCVVIRVRKRIQIQSHHPRAVVRLFESGRLQTQLTHPFRLDHPLLPSRRTKPIEFIAKGSARSVRV